MTTDLLVLTEELCAIPSVSGTEAVLADDIESRLRAAAPGLEIERIGANVVARTAHGAATASAADRIDQHIEQDAERRPEREQHRAADCRSAEEG